jgi:BlaI family transcriptional regulator, penicillinase repressor
VTRRNATRPHLTDLHQAILEFLWTNGPATAEHVREAIRPRHPLKDSSVRTLLRRLETKGFVNHRLDGKVFVYSAKHPPQSLAARAVRQIIDRLCHGSVEELVSGMVDANVLTKSELKRLEAVVRNRRQGGQ